MPLPTLPIGGIMVLGHDFHSEAEYTASLQRGYERQTQATWRTLIALFGAAHIHPLTCFFTNVYMGLRAGSETTGRFPGAADPAFIERCVAFLRAQLIAFQPSIIVTLGAYVPPLLARLSPDLHEWRSVTRLQDLDERQPFRPTVRFPNGGGSGYSAVVALTHPSQRRLNVHRRQYLGLTGDAAELRMLADACATLPIY